MGPHTDTVRWWAERKVLMIEEQRGSGEITEASDNE